MRRRDGVALLAAFTLAVLLAIDVVPALRGPENWRWARRPLESFVPLAGTAAIVAALAGVAAWIRARWLAGNFLTRAGALGTASILVFLQMVLLTAMEPGGLSHLPRRVMDPSFTSYHTIARHVEDPGRFLERYPRVQKTFPVHGPSQPPGRVLFFRAVNEWASASPERTERLLDWGERLGGVPAGPPGTTDGQRAGALAAAWLLLAVGALTLFPMAVVVGGRCDTGAVASSVLLMGTLPSYLLFTPQTDHLLLFLTVSAAALLLEAMRYASRPWAPALALGAGIAAGVSLFLSFTTLAALGAWFLLIVGMLGLAARRATPLPNVSRIVAILGGGLVGLAIPVGVVAAAGMDWLAVFRECVAAAHRVQVEIHGRVYSTWVLANLWDFTLFLGIGLLVHVFARVPAELRALRTGETSRVPEAPFALALLAAVLVLDVSGRILGETGRIWMFLMPLAVGAAAVALGRRPFREGVRLAGAQLIVLAALRAFLNVPG